MSNPFDQLAKKVALRALVPCGATVVQYEVASNARQADIRHDPDPSRVAERARLGLLGRLASLPCLIEVFSRAPGEEQILDCVEKGLAFRHARRGEALSIEPFLWIIAAGRPASALAMLGAVPADGWPRGVYLSPGAPLDASASPALAGMLRVGIVVATELSRERETILVRIMAGGAALQPALAELKALPADAPEREVASMNVVELRKALGGRPATSVEEEEFIVSTMDAFEELKEEGRVEGRNQGEVLARARDVLTVLRVRGLLVSDTARERILDERDAGRLERWLERAVVAASADEVIADPS